MRWLLFILVCLVAFVVCVYYAVTGVTHEFETWGSRPASEFTKGEITTIFCLACWFLYELLAKKKK